jgi:deoxycytidine triphosphate deaminase
MSVSQNLILEHYKEGNIIIDPFNPRNLSSTSYDVRLGPYFYRQLTLKTHGNTKSLLPKNSEKNVR